MNLLCGYNTLELMPTVTDQTLIVDTREHRLPDEVLENIDWVIGGKRTVEKYWDNITEFHLHVLDNYEEGDCTWPELVPNLFTDFILSDIVVGNTLTEYIFRRDNV